MNMVSYEVLDVARAYDPATAYTGLLRTLSGEQSLFVADPEARFNIESDQAQEIIAAAGFSQGPRTYPYAFGKGGDVPLLGFHRDGTPGSRLVQGVHVHETPVGTASATFVPMLRTPPHHLGEFVNWERREIDSDFLAPRVYRTVLEAGAIAVFAVSGRNALAHLFETMPNELAYREAIINTFHRN
jgi:hypothetical protein